VRFINVWSYGCANQLMLQQGDNHEKRRVYYYGFQIVIGGIVKLLILTILSLLLRSFIPAVIIAVTFATIRVQAGGYHMDTYGKCIATSLVLFLVSACIAQYSHSAWNTAALIILLVITLLVSVFLSLRYAPADNPNRPITRKEELRKFKKLTILTLGVWMLVFSLLLALQAGDYKLYTVAGCFGILLEMFTITPPGYAFFKWVSGHSIPLQTRAKVLK
jgi:accessory gene regulator B